ncbi:MAG: hypothetical protein LGR52_11410, partial [Candidatus Thiosymbion ectosymbiont of Robbea hypermnestra]|nr:hypothetical protein [Candidatus Thiosymbion ectosymbiont of Robbea hypermnestra]
SSTVRVNGQSVIRHGDPFTMNAGNTTGQLVYLEGAGGAPSIDQATTPPDQDEAYFRNIADTVDTAESAIEKEDLSALEQVGGFFKSIYLDVSEVVESAKDAVVYVVTHPPGETIDKIGEILEVIVDDPGAALEAIIAPVKEDWEQGRHGEAIGHVVTGVAGIFVGTKGIDKAAKAAKATKAAGKVAKEATEKAAKEVTEKAAKEVTEKAAKETAEKVGGAAGESGKLPRRTKGSGKIDTNPGDGIKVKGTNRKPGKKATDSSKAEKHGDSGRRLEKAEKQIKDLEKQLETASGVEKKRIKRKIKNIRQNAQKAKKGETHHRR